MKRALALATALLCVGALGVEARTAGRTVEKQYEPVTVTGGFPTGSIHSSNGVWFRARANESKVMVAIEDATGSTVPAKISYGDPKDDKYHEFCGATKAPVSIEPGAPVAVWMSHGSCGGVPGGELGGWTSGTITAIFSK